MRASHLPEIAADWALFLDLDGTLLDIASRPDAVVVPPGLVDSLRGMVARLNGAAAIVSSRPVGDVDRLLSPLAMPGGFGHGAETACLAATPPPPKRPAPCLGHGSTGCARRPRAGRV